MSEATFQSQILALCKHLGLLTYHTYDSRRSQPGFPDLVIVGSRKMLFRELKTDLGRVSPEQAQWLDALRQLGVDADVWRPSDWPTRVHAELLGLGRLSLRPVAPSQAEIRKRLAKKART